VNAGCRQVLWIQANEDAISATVVWDPHGNLRDVLQELRLSTQGSLKYFIDDLIIYVV
jgi:hypothetical protein